VRLQRAGGGAALFDLAHGGLHHLLQQLGSTGLVRYC
jgi:hypothetical protein